MRCPLDFRIFSHRVFPPGLSAEFPTKLQSLPATGIAGPQVVNAGTIARRSDCSDGSGESVYQGGTVVKGGGVMQIALWIFAVIGFLCVAVSAFVAGAAWWSVLMMKDELFPKDDDNAEN